MNEHKDLYYLYHITTEENLKLILESGEIIPQYGDNCKSKKDYMKPAAVYLCTEEDVANWVKCFPSKYNRVIKLCFKDDIISGKFKEYLRTRKSSHYNNAKEYGCLIPISTDRIVQVYEIIRDIKIEPIEIPVES